MKKVQDLTGKRFGKLLVLDRNYEKQEQDSYHKIYWNCCCDCGNTCVVAAGNLRSGNTLSCGCVKKQQLKKQKNTKNIQWIEHKEWYEGITVLGISFLIDKDDYEKVKNYCWRQDPRGYIIANARNGSNTIIRLHRLIMNATENQLVDHKDWNKTDNRKSNLRVATKTENNINIKRKVNNTSGYTGITQNKAGHYVARISKNGIRYYLGTYVDFIEAVEARHQAELVLHGEWSGEINRKDFQKIVQVKLKQNHTELQH